MSSKMEDACAMNSGQELIQCGLFKVGAQQARLIIQRSMQIMLLLFEIKLWHTFRCGKGGDDFNWPTEWLQRRGRGLHFIANDCHTGIERQKAVHAIGVAHPININILLLPQINTKLKF